jgi:hypothetical protein
MAGSAIDTFGDFMLSTGPAFLTGPEDVINEAVKHTYLLRRILSGKDMTETLQGGSTIKDIIFFDEDSTYESYKPNPSFTYRNPQVLTEHEIDWRFSKADMVWTDHEIALNTGDLSKSARFHKFKTLKRTKEQNLWTSIMNGMEDELWAAPPADGGLVEDTDGDTVYSFPMTITDQGWDTSGTASVVPVLTAANNHPEGWTTVQGINPADQAKWTNRVEFYTDGPTSTTGFDLFPAMSRMWHRLRFDQLPMRPDLSDRTTVPQFIACSLAGLTNYEDMLRNSQDAFVMAGRQDPAYNHPTFRGIDLIYVSTLDDAAIYDGGIATTGYVDEATATAAEFHGGSGARSGPRYWFINGKYLNKIFHRDRYFYKKPPFTPSQQPFTHVMVVDIWHNCFNRSRRRHGIISPNGALA